jgi:hypothetical protein
MTQVIANLLNLVFFKAALHYRRENSGIVISLIKDSKLGTGRKFSPGRIHILRRSFTESGRILAKWARNLEEIGRFGKFVHYRTS